MKNQIILWLCSLLILFVIGYIKNITDKNYPLTGTFGIEGYKVSYKLDKVSYEKMAYKNIIISDIKGFNGKIFWLKDNEIFESEFKETERGLECEIPILRPGQQIDYKIILAYQEKQFEIPDKEFVTLTFWGHIPLPIQILNFIFLYGVLLMSIRSLLEIFNKNINLKKFSVITSVLLIFLVMIISPLKNSYKLGAINHFVPTLVEIIEPVLILILFFWIIGTILIFYKKYTTPVTIFITSVTVLLFFYL